MPSSSTEIAPAEPTDGDARTPSSDAARRDLQRAETAFWHLERELEQLRRPPVRRVWFPRPDGDRICLDPCGEFVALRLYRRHSTPDSDADSAEIAFLRAARLPAALLDPVDAELLEERGLFRPERGYFVPEKMARCGGRGPVESADVHALASACREVRSRLNVPPEDPLLSPPSTPGGSRFARARAKR